MAGNADGMGDGEGEFGEDGDGGREIPGQARDDEGGVDDGDGVDLKGGSHSDSPPSPQGEPGEERWSPGQARDDEGGVDDGDGVDLKGGSHSDSPPSPQGEPGEERWSPGQARDDEDEAGLPRRFAARNDEGGGDAPVPDGDDPARIAPNKHRRVQVVRTGGRKLFDKAAQAVFLEWFAATANLSWSAELTGFNYKTVLRHRMNDERFAEACDRAMAQAYVRIEAKRVETKKREVPIGIEGDWDAPEMDEMAPERMDAILRDRERALARGGVGGERRRHGRRPRMASNGEVSEALIKRLWAYRERVRGPNGNAVIASEAKQSSAELDRHGADAPRDDDSSL